MNGLRLTPLVVMIPLTVALSALALSGCASDEEVGPPEAPRTTVQGGPSCDDFDTYCDKAHPCAAGSTCLFDADHCGSNFSGQYPACSVSATCYATCQPTPTCDDFDSYCDASHPCAEGFTCALDTSHCGTNVFGQYPDCGASATCYPACQPNP